MSDSYREPSSRKALACYAWYHGDKCIFSEENCRYTHKETGIIANQAARVSPRKGPTEQAGSNGFVEEPARKPLQKIPVPVVSQPLPSSKPTAGYWVEGYNEQFPPLDAGRFIKHERTGSEPDFDDSPKSSETQVRYPRSKKENVSQSGVIGTPMKVEGGESPGSDPRAYHSESPKKPGLRHKIKFGSFPDNVSNMGQQERISSVSMPDIRKGKGRVSPEAAQGGPQGALSEQQPSIYGPSALHKEHQPVPPGFDSYSAIYSGVPTPHPHQTHLPPPNSQYHSYTVGPRTRGSYNELGNLYHPGTLRQPSQRSYDPRMAEPNALPDPAHLPTGWVRLHPPAISMPVGSGPDDYAAAGLSADSYPTMSALRAALPSVEQTPATPETDSDGGVSTNPSPTREKAEEPRGGLQVDDRTFTFGLTKAEKKAASDALRDIENYEHYYHSAIKRRVENLAEEQQVIQDLSTVNLIGPSGPMVQQLLKRTEKKLQELVTRFQDLETYTGNHLQGKRAILYELGLIREESMTTHHE